MNDDLHDKEIEKNTDPELDHGDIEDLDEFVGDTLQGQRTSDVIDDESAADHPGDMGASGDVGLEELATQERLEEEEFDARESMRVPSDMRSPGDPNAGDVGISGGIATGDMDISETEGSDFGEGEAL